MTNPNECWAWTRHKNKHGYGIIQISGKSFLVHRLAFHIFKGPLFNKQIVCHSCDTPSCWNPDHLFAGTQKDNIRDCQLKGRGANQKGEHNNGAKLTNLAAMAIRDLYATGNYSQRNLAKRFDVTQGSIWNILERRTFKNVMQS